MSNKPQPTDQQFWENEVLYFENAIDGLKTSYAILNSLLENARQKLIEHTPEREEVPQ